MFQPESASIKTNITKGIQLESPIISSGMPTVTESKMAIAIASAGGLGLIHQFLSLDRYFSEIDKVKKCKLLVGAELFDNDFERAKVAVSAGADILVVDAPNGEVQSSLKFIRKLKMAFPKKAIVAGFFVTPSAVIKAIHAGADAVRVGIGPGSHCTTRVVAGVGVPQITAIQECFVASNRYDIPLWAEGGIRQSGDIVKAIAVGASAVVIGGLFSGTEESPGRVIYRHNKKYKETWGHATNKANSSQHSNLSGIRYIKWKIKLLLGIAKEKQSHFTSEGAEKEFTLYKGSVNQICTDLQGGLKSGMAYVGASDIKQLRRKANLIQVTTAGVKEGNIHDVYTEKDFF